MSLKYPGPHFPAVSVVNVEASFPVVFPSGAVINLPTNAGDLGSFPGSGRSPGEGNSNPLQYSCLKNPMDRGAWQAIVHRVAKNQK